MQRADRAYFASVQDALVFAFNHEDLSIPGPVMNREMAQGLPGQAQSPGNRPGKASPPATPKTAPMGGLADRTVVAGWILLRVATLDEVHRNILAGQCIKPKRPCSCGRACCRGWTIKKEWVEATRWLVNHLKEQADIAKEPGKRGYSTDPRLRIALVEDFMSPEKKRRSLADLAFLTETTNVTVAKHKALIFEYLGGQADLAWDAIAHDLDDSGLVGALGVGE